MIEIDVQKEGVKGAKAFFETQVNIINWNIRIISLISLKKKALKQQSSNNFEREIREEQEEKKRIEMERKMKREEFLAKKSIFNQWIKRNQKKIYSNK